MRWKKMMKKEKKKKPAKDPHRRRALTVGLYVRGLALLHFISFTDISTQILPLIGSKGIQPMETHLSRLRAISSSSHIPFYLYFSYPSIFWASSSDSAIWWSCIAGSAISLQLLFFGSTLLDSRVALTWMYVLLLSLCSVGGDFFAFPWDYLLCEATFLAALFLPPIKKRGLSLTALSFGESLGVLHEPSNEAIWVIHWLVFRFNLSMGVEKIPLINGNAHWANMTYLTRFYETEQPMPTPLAWYAHFLPEWIHVLCCWATWILEIIVPILAMTCGPNLQRKAALLMCLLQLPIALTGNYSILNWLSVVLCIPLLDDSFFYATCFCGKAFPPEESPTQGRSAKHTPFILRLFIYMHSTFGAILLVRMLTSLDYLGNTNWLFDEDQYGASLMSYLELENLIPVVPISLREVLLFGAAYHICGQWGGVFHDSFSHTGKVVMVLEVGWDSSKEVGTAMDNIYWKELSWRYHVSDPNAAPPFIAPFFPRLDHSIFYEINGIGFNRINPLAPLRNRAVSGSWFLQFLQRLIDGGSETSHIWALLNMSNPVEMAKNPPKYVRARRYLYKFAKAEKAEKVWWTREEHGMYVGTACKGDDNRCAHLNCVALCSYIHPEMPYEFCQRNTPPSCQLPGGIFNHKDPASKFFEIERSMNIKATENVLLSHFLSEIPASYITSLANIYTMALPTDDFDRSSILSKIEFSDVRLINVLLDIYKACEEMQLHKQHPICAKLL